MTPEPDHPRLRDRRGRARDAHHPHRAARPPRASTAAAPTATPAAGSPSLTQVRDLPEAQLPTRTPRSDGPPPPRAWADKDPVAARRLLLAREAITATSEELKVPAENLLTPDFVRRVLWTPPSSRDLEPLTRAISVALRDMGARAWQVRLTAPLLADAVLAADEARSRYGARLRSLGRIRRFRLRSRRRRLRTEDRLRHGVDLGSPSSGRSMVGTAKNISRRNGSTASSSSSQVSSSGGITIRPTASLKTVPLSGLLVGLEEVVGERDLLVGRLEVALAHDLAHRLGARGVDHEVRGRGGALGVLRDAEAGDLADGRRALDRRDRHHVEAEVLHLAQLRAPARGCR